MLAPVTHTDLAFYWTGVIIALLFFYATVVSIFEKEKHAAGRFLSLGIILAAVFILVSFIDFQGKDILAIIIACFLILSILLVILPIQFRDKFEFHNPIAQFDERDTMFSRKELKPGSSRFDEYYTDKKKKLELDDKFRQYPGLLSPESNNYNPLAYSAADASFYTIAALKDKVDGVISDDRIKASPEELTEFIKKWTIKLGALNVGITELKEYHRYSIRGRGVNYGKDVKLSHRYAIALTVEMDFEQVRSGPLSPIVMESAQQYLSSGAIAVQIAELIRNSGYAARAHIDGNYEVICPLVARDAGLGELGRMGLLMTPKQGPRVRIAVVTTDLPLIVDDPTSDRSMTEFCTYCKKCAENCPSNSISFDDREVIDGTLRWQIDQESCFTFWTKSGTDCGRCMSVCPYSHPDNILHNIVRYGIKNSSIFSKAAVKLDDYFYGRKPKVKPVPDWLNIN